MKEWMMAHPWLFFFIVTCFSRDVMILVGSFGFAELLGVVEELVDGR